MKSLESAEAIWQLGPTSVPLCLCGSSSDYHLAMHHRRFANTRIDISEVGLGCWQLGGADWGDVSDEKAFEILRASIESGVGFLDTADVYGRGRSEALIGRFLKAEKPRKLFIATKVGRFPDPAGPANF